MLWTVLAMAFEFSFGHFIGRSWRDLVADYDVGHGRLFGFGMIVLLFSPVAAKLRGIGRARTV